MVNREGWRERIAEIRAERDAQIIELRAEGATQAQIAEALGVSVGHVNKVLTGEDTTPAPGPESRPTAVSGGAPANLERLRSGAVAGDAADDDDPATIADRIMRRHDWRTR